MKQQEITILSVVGELELIPTAELSRIKCEHEAIYETFRRSHRSKGQSARKVCAADIGKHPSFLTRLFDGTRNFPDWETERKFIEWCGNDFHGQWRQAQLGRVVTPRSPADLTKDELAELGRQLVQAQSA